MKILLASQNPGKVREIRAILAGAGVEVEAAPSTWVPPAETGASYLDNARLKARSLAEHTGLPVVADDSGIEVYALDGAPGVRSARFAGDGATDRENLDAMLACARTIPEGLRGARYRCVAVLVDPFGQETVTEGTLDGCIVLEPRGTNGFGYDPIFGLEGDETRTAAELEPEEKDAISHRGQAFRALAPAVRAIAARGDA